MKVMMMATFTVHEAKTNLSKLIERAEAGEEVIIARGGTPVVRLIPLEGEKTARQPGMLRGFCEEPPAEFFFEPLPEAELKSWQDEKE